MYFIIIENRLTSKRGLIITESTHPRLNQS